MTSTRNAAAGSDVPPGVGTATATCPLELRPVGIQTWWVVFHSILGLSPVTADLDRSADRVLLGYRALPPSAAGTGSRFLEL